jgi:ribosomal protein L21E
LEGYLRCFVSSCQKKWVQWIPLAEFWYNTTVHSTLGKTPFEVLYGHAPRHFGVDVTESCAITDLDQWLKERDTMVGLLRQYLLRQQQRMKTQADKHRIERHFQVGDCVYLKLQPYVQKSVAVQGNRKLAPYKILEKFRKVAYRLQLPQSSQIHSVIHVSQLKKAVGAQTVVHTDLPDGEQVEPIPEMILDKRWIKKGASSQCQVLVRWTGLPDSVGTWECMEHLKRRYPKLPAWGQAGPQGAGNVMDQDSDMPSGKQRRKQQKAGRRPARISGPEWTT